MDHENRTISPIADEHASLAASSRMSIRYQGHRAGSGGEPHNGPTLEVIKLAEDGEISLSLTSQNMIICTAMHEIDSVGFIEHITGGAQLTCGDVAFTIPHKDVAAMASLLGRERAE